MSCLEWRGKRWSCEAENKVLPGSPRQIRTNYRCSNQGLAGFACRTSTAPDSASSETHVQGMRNVFF